jgi:hypothetical protein
MGSSILLDEEAISYSDVEAVAGQFAENLDILDSALAMMLVESRRVCGCNFGDEPQTGE